MCSSDLAHHLTTVPGAGGWRGNPLLDAISDDTDYSRNVKDSDLQTLLDRTPKLTPTKRYLKIYVLAIGAILPVLQRGRVI